MAESDAIAGRLTEGGWQQGDLIGPLSASVVFDPDQPYSKMAKAAARTEVQKLPDVVRHGVATKPLPPSHRMVVASQTCDIVRNLEQEPNVIALEAFYTSNPRVVAEAQGNSSRYFLLDPSQGLVADGRRLVTIEKPLLAALDRLPGAPDREIRAQFARWLARRFNRPALPDDVVAHVARPLTNGLAHLRETDAEARHVLSRVSDLRIAPLNGEWPYQVRLLFMIESDAGDRRSTVLGIAGIVVEMKTWLTEHAEIAAWDAADLYEVSAGDYLNTIPLYTEHLTEQGNGRDEALPPQYGSEDFT